MKRVVMFSGGAGSWAAAKRVAEQHGTDDLVRSFARYNPPTSGRREQAP